MKRRNQRHYGKRFVLTALAAACCAVALGHWPQARLPTAGQPAAGELNLVKYPHVLGEVLVAFKSATTAPDRALIHAEVGAFVISRIPELRVDRVRSTRGETTEQLIQRYLPNPLVEYAEPNYLSHVTATPNDPKFPQQWSLNNTGQSGTCSPAGVFDVDIDAPEAWNLQTGSSTIVVAVIDTGVNYNHPDLAANIWSNPGESNCTNGIDDDGDGFVDDCRGWDFVNSDNAPLDDYGHGTHVAGILGAVGNNATGIAGVAWTVKLMPLKTFNSSGTGDTGDIANAILYARDRGARIINYSAGDVVQSTTITNAIGSSPNVLFVSAAGSQSPAGHDEDVSHFYPCDTNYGNIVCVTDTDQTDVLDPLANWGLTTVDLGAPGVNILSTAIAGAVKCGDNFDPVNALACCTGTSMAVPHVAGVAALMFAQRSSLTVAQAKTILINTVDPITALAGRSVSGGRLNAFKAVQSAGDTTSPSTPANLDAHYVSAQGGVSLSWTASTDNIGVHHYEVLRTAKITVSYTVIGTSTSTSFLDSSVVTNPVTAYLYKVHALDAAGNVSGDSNVDLATATGFTDDPLLVGTTTIRAVHVSEVRTAVNAVRTTANLSASTWTDDPLVVGATNIKAVHVSEMRTSLTAARTALGFTDPPFTDPTLTPGSTAVKAVHISELRTRTK